MIGRQTLRETKAQVRHAFAKSGMDVEKWLDQQMAKLSREPKPTREAVKSLRQIRDALRRHTPVRRNKQAARKRPA